MIGAKQIVRSMLVFVLLSLVLAACGSSSATPTTSLPIDTEIPTQRPAYTGPLLSFPEVNCCRGKSLEAGRYELPTWFGIPLTVEVGEGWKVLNEEAALLFEIGRGENIQKNPSQMIVFLNVTGRGSPETLISSVKNAPELTTTAESVSVTIAGFSGLQLDSTAKPNPGYAGDPAADIPPEVQFLPVFMKYFTPGFLWTTSSPEARVRTIALTIDNQTLLLYLEAPQEEFEAFTVDAEQILQSLELVGN